MMKVKRGKKMGALFLGLIVAGTVLAGAGVALAADPAQGVQRDPAPPEIVAKQNTIWDNRIEMAALRLQCLEAADEIRHKVQELRQAGGQLPEETREAVKSSREAVRAGKDAIRATFTAIKGEWDAVAEDRAAGDWTAMGGHLDNIIALQGTILEEGGNVYTQLQTILSLLDQVG